jgi:hypothetical protein
MDPGTSQSDTQDVYVALEHVINSLDVKHVLLFIP